MATLTGNDEGRATIPHLGLAVDFAMTCTEELHCGFDKSVVGSAMQWINARFRDANGVWKSSKIAIT